MLDASVGLAFFAFRATLDPKVRDFDASELTDALSLPS